MRKDLRVLVRAAEAELEAATKPSDLNLAAKKLMQAKAALKAANGRPSRPRVQLATCCPLLGRGRGSFSLSSNDSGACT
jgi:hypothetical protein